MAKKAMTKKVATSIEVTWKKQAGGTVKTQVILVPIRFKGELLALHYVS